MTKKVVITLGIWGVGKTYYIENKFLKDNPKYKLVDTHPDLPVLFKQMKKHDYVVMDYYFRKDFNADEMRKVLGCEVEVVVLFDRPEVISHRQIFTKSGRSNSNVDCFASKLVYTQELRELIDPSSAKYVDGDWKEYSFEEFLEKYETFWQPVTKKEIQTYLEKIELMKGYDKHYHEVDLPFKFKMGKKGYAMNKETWEVIKEMYDWKNKKVLDLGCFHAYYCQEIKKAGGVPVGCDRSTTVLYTAALFAKWKKIQFKLYQCDLGSEDEAVKNFPPGNFDLVMLLSAFHHLPNQEQVLKQMQEYPQSLFEINKTKKAENEPLNDREKIEKFFTVVKECESPKFERVILLCEPKR